MIYTTKSLIPYAVVGSIHYQELTDIAWSNSDRLIISSWDGFITLIKFDSNELGQKMSFPEIPKIVSPLFEWMFNYWDLATCEPSKTIEITPAFISWKQTNSGAVKVETTQVLMDIN